MPRSLIRRTVPCPDARPAGAAAQLGPGHAPARRRARPARRGGAPPRPAARRLRRARPLDRRAAALDEGGAHDLRAADGDCSAAGRRRPPSCSPPIRRRSAPSGLSRPKVSYLRSLAEHVESRRARARPPDRALRRRGHPSSSTAVKGLGQWTADMFLIFHLGRPDVLPVGDLGIRRAVERAYGLDELPDAAQAARDRRAVAAAPLARVALPLALARQRARLADPAHLAEARMLVRERHAAAHARALARRGTTSAPRGRGPSCRPARSSVDAEHVDAALVVHHVDDRRVGA